MSSGRPGRRAGLLGLLPLLLFACLPAPAPRLPSESGGRAWEIPPAAFATQRLYRVGYQGPEGKLGLRLTLYLVGPSDFRMDAADGVGRRVFSLEVRSSAAAAGAAPTALWLDHRNKVYCRLSPSGLPRDLPLANLPLEALPRLLLGVMPAPPASELAEHGGKLSFRDAAGQEWSGSVGAGGRLEAWTLSEAGQPIAWWQRQPSETIYSDRRAGLQVRLEEHVVEPLKARPSPLLVPEGYLESACALPR